MGRIARTDAMAAAFSSLSCILIFFAGSAGSARGAPAPKTGLLRVNTTPLAQVYVDGESIGLTPVRDYSLRPGPHRVELRISDGRSHFQAVQIQAGATLTVVHKFAPPRLGGPGTLAVTTEPWSQVFLDGRAVGTTPLEGYRANARSYNMELKTADGRSYKRIVFIEADRTTQVFHRFSNPEDPPRAGPSGWLDVASDPVAEVWVDGKKIGVTPMQDHDLSVGLHVVTLKIEDGRRHTRQLQIVRDKTTQFVHRFPRKEEVEEIPNAGRISVASNVEAEVRVDGKSVGWTPLLRHPLRPGRHVVTIVTPKRQRRTYTVFVQKGYTRTISVRF